MLSVGNILKKEREKQGKALKDVEKALRVREKFLSDIENNQWTNFSSRIYIEGIIKNYAKYLGIDPQRALAFFRRDFAKKDDVRFRQRVPHRYLTSQSRRYRIFVFFLICILFLSYFVYQVMLYLSPPRLQILEPTVSTFKREQRIKIVGKTEREAVVTIFGERVYQDKEGVFEYQFPLKKGKNTLKVDVTGANGKKTEVTKEYFNQ